MKNQRDLQHEVFNGDSSCRSRNGSLRPCVKLRSAIRRLEINNQWMSSVDIWPNWKLSKVNIIQHHNVDKIPLDIHWVLSRGWIPKTSGDRAKQRLISSPHGDRSNLRRPSVSVDGAVYSVYTVHKGKVRIFIAQLGPISSNFIAIRFLLNPPVWFIPKTFSLKISSSQFPS